MDWHDLDHINSNISLGDNGRQHMKEDWDCEMELSHYKTENAGRVSTIFMRHLRNKYGEDIANKALKRTQKREERERIEEKEHRERDTITDLAYF